MSDKYIYELYKASDGRFNIERKTIIYENSEYIYFKKSGNDRQLAHVLRSEIYDNVSEVPVSYFTDAFYGRRYLYTYDESKDKGILDKRQSGSWIADLNRKIYQKELEVSRLRSELDKKVQELNNLKTKLAELKSEEVANEIR